jgi:hypothetical protein
LDALREEVMNSKGVSFFSVVAMTILLPSIQARAVVRYVAADGPGGNGQSWATAYKTIQGAINDGAMTAGGEIHVKAGVYALTQTIQVGKAIVIYGGYSGVGETRDWTTYNTYVGSNDKVGRCFSVTANATIDGFLIFNGISSTNGGAMSVTSCGPTISNCYFKSNTSAGFGGALATYKGTGTKVSNCTFSGNSVDQCGGAIYNESTTSMQITDCTFTENTAKDSGGALHNLMSNVTVTRCVFQSNRGTTITMSVGGAVLNEACSPVFSNCAFSDNRAAYGAGMYNYYGAPVIDGCLFSECGSGCAAGGGVYVEGGTSTITNCLFQLNYVWQAGGGLLTEGAGGKIINCVFWKNDAAYSGAAIYIAGDPNVTSGPNPQFINCTIYGNHTDGVGGAVCCEEVPATFLNCIMWGNTASVGNPGIYAVAGWETNKPAARYCDIQGDTTYPGTGNLRANPKLGDPNHLDFGLAFDSPCLDAGNNAAVMGTLKDYEEANRVMDGDGDGTALVDMGACELQRQPDHLTRGEIMRCAVYDSPSDSSPTYTFMLRLQTDDGLTSVEFQAPNGTGYTIPSNAETSSGNVETYHRVHGKVHTWEYWAKADSPSALSAYGDGTYHLTIHYRDSTQAQLQVVYGTDTGAAIKQPGTQKPQINSPSYGGTAASPVTFQWAACTDTAADNIRLTIADANVQEVAGDVYPRTATESNAYTLAEGSYEAELAFGNLYDVAASDQTPFQCGKATLIGHQFTVGYAEIYRFFAPGILAHFYTADESEKDYLIGHYGNVWVYEGVAFKAWRTKVSETLRPVYRFWSGRSHFYTIDENEKNYLISRYASVWSYEGIAFYAYADGTEPAGSRAVYRFWCAAAGTHFYTIDESEANYLLEHYADLFSYECVAFYAYP